MTCPHPGPGGDRGATPASQPHPARGDDPGEESSCDLDTSLPSPGYVRVPGLALNSLEEAREQQGEDIPEDEVMNFYSGNNAVFN